MKKIIFFLFILSALALSGQKTISGKVVDLHGFGQLIGVSVSAYSKDSIDAKASFYDYKKSYVYGVYTDINGEFSLRVPDSAETLNFLYDGWTTTDLEIPPAKNGQVHLGIIPLEPYSYNRDEKPKPQIRVTGKVIDLNGEAPSNVTLLFQNTKEAVLPWPDGSFSTKIYEESKRVYIYYNDVWTCRTISIEEKDKLILKIDGEGTSYDPESYNDDLRDKIKCY